jgi:hypothetical protein
VNISGLLAELPGWSSVASIVGETSLFVVVAVAIVIVACIVGQIVAKETRVSTKGIRSAH